MQLRIVVVVIVVVEEVVVVVVLVVIVLVVVEAVDLKSICTKSRAGLATSRENKFLKYINGKDRNATNSFRNNFYLRVFKAVCGRFFDYELLFSYAACGYSLYDVY